MRRALASAFALLATLATTAHAQSQGTIVYTWNGSNSVDVATGAVDAVPSGRPTSRSDYPGGRLYFVRDTTGKAPGSDVTIGDHYLEDSLGNRVLVTAFYGPDYYTYRFGSNLLSNDGMDSFYSFWVYDRTTGHYLFYRAHITPSDILAPDFVPLTLPDPQNRLELILVVDNSQDATRIMDWNPESTGVVHIDDYLYKGTSYDRLLIHHVGPDVTPANDEVVTDERLSGVDFRGSFEFSPLTGNQLLTYTDAGRGGRGIAVWSRGAAGWSYAWVQKEFSTKSSGLASINYPVYSPDGTGVAFWGRVYRNGTWVWGIYRCPAGGGAIQAVLGFGSDSNTRTLNAWVW